MDYEDVTKLEKRLLATLKEEYSFYQSLFILIDKQRDHIKYDRDQKLVDLYSEIERLYSRITESEEQIAKLRSGNKKLFALAASAPEVRRMVNSITTLITKALKIVKENEEAANGKYQAIQQKLAELQKSSKIASYLRVEQTAPQYVDRRN